MGLLSGRSGVRIAHQVAKAAGGERQQPLLKEKIMTAFVTVSLATLLALPGVSCAQESSASGGRFPVRAHKASDTTRAQDEQQPGGPGQSNSQTPRRLESVSWNPVKHELTWVVSRGQLTGSDYKPLATENYLINMDDATMTYNGETRRFSRQEADNVTVLMDLLSKYAVDSTVWWDQGHGQPVDGSSPAPATPTPAKRKKANVLHVSAPRRDQALERRIMAQLDRLQQAVFPAY
jgi:hypothetical protein